MDAGGKRGCSVNRDGWGKALSEHSANRRRDVLGRGNSKCKCPETGQSLTHGGSREASMAGTAGAKGRAAGDEITGRVEARWCRALETVMCVLALI